MGTDGKLRGPRSQVVLATFTDEQFAERVTLDADVWGRILKLAAFLGFGWATANFLTIPRGRELLGLLERRFVDFTEVNDQAGLGQVIKLLRKHLGIKVVEYASSAEPKVSSRGP